MQRKAFWEMEECFCLSFGAKAQSMFAELCVGFINQQSGISWAGGISSFPLPGIRTQKMLGRSQQRNFNEYSSGLLKTALFLVALALLLSCYTFIFVAGAAEGHGDTY